MSAFIVKLIILFGILLSDNTLIATKLINKKDTQQKEHWPEFNPTSQQIKLLNHRFSGIYGTFHNTKYREYNTLPYQKLSYYLNSASSGCEERLLKNNYHGKLYFNPTTLSHRALGCYGRYLIGQKGSLESFIRHANLLIDLQSNDGGYQYPTKIQHKTYGILSPGWVSAMTQGQVLSIFARAYKITHDVRYLNAGDKAYSNLQKPIRYGGTRASLSGLDPSLDKYIFFPEWEYKKIPYTLNGYLFTLLGIHDWSLIASPSQKDARSDFKAGINTLQKILHYYNIDGYSTYDLAHIIYGTEPKVEANYMSVHVYLLHAINLIVSNQTIRHYEKIWTDKLDKLNAQLHITGVSFKDSSGNKLSTNQFNPTPQVANSYIDISISAAGGTGAKILYQFAIKFNGKWTYNQPFSENSSFRWKPVKSGNYDIGLFVKNFNSNKKYDNFRAVKFKILEVH